jgi:cyclopropane-fatty-acyl-phospholipid synthase
MKHSIGRDKQAIAHHYDVGNDFYGLFLGQDMVYSCAYFKSGGEDIDQAQTDKMEHICRKLRLREGEKLLDIGCGWGGLIIYAAKKYKVSALGITLSEQQYRYARDRIKSEGLGNLCQVELKDYRELKGEGLFDKVVSVGMFEHVGLKKLPLYLKIASRLLKEKGLFLNHGITQERKDRGKSSGTKFINTYIFPGGELASISHVHQTMEEAGFEILDVESLRQHYAKTLRLWTLNLQGRKAEAIKIAGERIYRTWLIYLAGSAYGFEKGNINIYQTLLSKHEVNGLPRVPLTREDLYFPVL